MSTKNDKLIAGIDKDLLPCERSTHIYMDDTTVRGDCFITVDSYQKTVIKHLLNNEDFLTKNMRKEGNIVTYISGFLPLNSIRIKDKATGKNSLYYILNH
jgi:hypothetical protein